MSGTISTRWFWSDWMSDPGLRACGYAARGLWKDLLCIAGANKREYGFVSLNGHRLDPTAIAQMTNGTVAEVEPLLAELERNGVFSRDRRGIIYCRRMVRAEKSRRNGRLGGNPNLIKGKDNPKQVEPKPKAPIPEPKPIPESKTLFGPNVPKSDWPSDYRERFWAKYPRKTEKKAAIAKLDAIMKSGKVDWIDIDTGLDRYLEHIAQSRTEERYIKHPATWLNRGCWDDQHTPPTGGYSNGTHRNDDGDSRHGIGYGAIAARIRHGRTAPAD